MREYRLLMSKVNDIGKTLEKGDYIDPRRVEDLITLVSSYDFSYLRPMTYCQEDLLCGLRCLRASLKDDILDSTIWLWSELMPKFALVLEELGKNENFD